jgi:hypothetical protein
VCARITRPHRLHELDVVRIGGTLVVHEASLRGQDRAASGAVS